MDNQRVTNQDISDALYNELVQVVTAIEQITGLVTNWNRDMELMPLEVSYFGMKPFTCGIRLRIDLFDAKDRWRTLLHEAFHATSTEYNAKAFLENIGWEEGLVEKLQRLFRGRILEHIGVEASKELFVIGDEQHAFNRYVRALESIQPLFFSSEDDFYLMLIQTPVKDRYNSLLQTAMRQEANARKHVLSALSTAHAMLKDSLHELP